MEAPAKTSQIRLYIAMRLESLGALADSNLTESLLMRDGRYCGHRFRRDSLQAVWFVEEDQIKFYHSDGSVAGKVCASEVSHTAPLRRAA